MNPDNLNQQLAQYPFTAVDKGWVYGVWYCGTSFTKSSMYGQHPPTYMKRLLELFPDCKVWLHAPSGSLPHGEINGRVHHTVDLVSRADNCPEFIGDVTKLPFANESIDIIETDPPYSEVDSKKYGLTKYPRYKARDEFWRVLKKGGYLAWLDVRYPMYRRKDWKLIGLIGIVTGFERQTRILSIFEKLGE